MCAPGEGKSIKLRLDDIPAHPNPFRFYTSSTVMPLISIRSAAVAATAVCFLTCSVPVINAWGPRSECVGAPDVIGLQMELTSHITEIYNAKSVASTVFTMH